MLKKTSLLAIALILAACNNQPPTVTTPPSQSQPKPSEPTRAIGTVVLPIDTSSSGPQTLNARAAARPGAELAILRREAIAVNTDSSGKYISATFRVKNNSATYTFTNLTLYAYSTQGSIAGTAISDVTQFGGAGDASAAVRQALPTQGTRKTGNSIELDPKGLDFQAFSSAQAASLSADARSQNIIGAADTVLEYGYSVRKCPDAACRAPTVGALAPGEEGEVTFGIKVPGNSDLFRFNLNMLVTDEATRQETRGVYPLEDLNAAQARATAASATLVQTAPSTLNPQISTQPTFLLPATCDSNAPALTQRIPAIQGSGSSTTFVGPQTTEGVVTAVFPGLNGFFLQDKAGDGDVNTSDGIFVFSSSLVPSSGAVGVALNDFVRVSGTVSESNGQTQIGGTVTTYKCSRDALPALTTVNFPLPTNQADLEKYEGMRVGVAQQMTVTETFQLGRFGQVTLSSADPSSNQPGTDDRLDQFSQWNTPSSTGYANYLTKLVKRRVLLDDGVGKQNPDPIVLGRGGTPLSATNTLRGGDTVTGVEGILTEGCHTTDASPACSTTNPSATNAQAYRIQTLGPVNFAASNPRPVTAPDVSGGQSGVLKVVSFNVLNFFSTLDPGNSSANFTPPGPGCSSTSIQPRGANTLVERDRQLDKTARAIVGLNADVVGLFEVQNDGATTVNRIVDAVNALAGAGTYVAVTDPANGVGCDAIHVVFIYKPSAVRPVGVAVSPPDGYTADGAPLSATNPAPFDNPPAPPTAATGQTGRKPVAVTFEQLPAGSGKVFTAVMNHWKSKGSSAGGPGDTVNAANPDDGSASSNGTRTRSAQAVLRWLGTTPTGIEDPDYLLMGDLNAYAQEQPISTLTAAGYVKFVADSAYSYIFDAQTGSLDHALGSAPLAPQLAGADKWHINSDEPTVLDYNTEFKSAGQVSSLYSTEPYRSTDHDPVLVGLKLTGGTTVPTTPTLTGVSSASGRILVPSSGPAYVSGVISDFTDPASQQGLNFTLSSASATVTASSSDPTVVPASGLVVSGSGTNRTLKITPSSVGKAVITVTVTEGGLSSSYTVNYAASKASSTPGITRFHTDESDASTAIALDANYMLVGDDEQNAIKLYDRANSGLPLAAFDYTSSLGLTDTSGGVLREVDIEASTRVGNTLYWMGSLSNKSDTGASRPNRNRVFSTTLSGTGATSSLSFTGYYKFLREDLVAWDSSNGHGLGANYLGLSVSTAIGKPGEGVDGFNLEGLSMSSGSNTVALLAFRAPLEDTVNRNKALVVPVTNFTTLPSAGGGTAGSATFGAPILLDLGGRGIREIKCSAGVGEGCFILAGPYGSGTNFALYSWGDGPGETPQLRQDLSSLAVESGGSLESMVGLPAGNLASSAVDGQSLQLLSDNGDTVYYGDTIIAKNLAQNTFKKFRSDTVTVSSVTGPVACTVSSVSLAVSNVTLTPGGTSQLAPFVTSNPLNCATVTWASNNGNATVSPTGLVTAVSAGSSIVTVTATGTSGSTASSTANITVNAVAADFSLTLGAITPSSFVAGTAGTATATLTLTPVGGYSGTPSYTVNNTGAPVPPGTPAEITGTVSGTTVNLVIPASLAAGTYPVTVKGFDFTLGTRTSNIVNVNVVGKVIMSQIYGGGGNTGAQFNRDFVELKNVSATAVNLSGYSLQYQSSAGPAWTVISALPTYNLQPGQYYLIHSGSAPGTNGAALPAADATVSSTSGLSSTNGKLALVNGTTALTCSSNATCLPNSSILDLVGYGSNTAAVFEGTGPVATLSNTTAAIRKAAGCTDTDNNSSDFDVLAPSPRNSSTTLAPCP